MFFGFARVADVPGFQAVANGDKAGVQPAGGVAVGRVGRADGLDGVRLVAWYEVAVTVAVDVDVELAVVVDVGLYQRCGERDLLGDGRGVGVPVDAEGFAAGGYRAKEEVLVVRADGGGGEVMPAVRQRVAGLALVGQVVARLNQSR